jgi:hypothetical protein
MKKKVKEALKKRSSLNDNFRNLNGYSWDYVLVFKVFKKDERMNAQQKIHSFKKVLSALADGGIETKVFYSSKVIILPLALMTLSLRLLSPGHRLTKYLSSFALLVIASPLKQTA